MKLPDKIGIVDTPQSGDSRLRFDTWEGFDQKKQIKYLAIKINELLSFLEEHPDITNEFGSKVKQEGNKVIHEHTWKLDLRLGGRGFYSCEHCGETQIRHIPAHNA